MQLEQTKYKTQAEPVAHFRLDEVHTGLDFTQQFITAKGFTCALRVEIVDKVQEAMMRISAFSGEEPVTIKSDCGAAIHVLENDEFICIFRTAKELSIIDVGTDSFEFAARFELLMKDLRESPDSDDSTIMRKYFTGNSFSPYSASTSKMCIKDIEASFNKNFYAVGLSWIDEYIDSTENIVIFCGAPGTGKTALARWMAVKNAKAVDFCTSKDILLVEEFWNDIARSVSDFLILDDVDQELGNRQANDYMRKILTFADGLLTMNKKIIITTNTGFSHLDSALTRPGRCFDVFEFEGLTLRRAKDIWINDYKKTAEEFEFFFGNHKDGEISPAEIVSCSRRVLTRRIRQCDARLSGAGVM